jgi:hypothetical protein
VAQTVNGLLFKAAVAGGTGDSTITLSNFTAFGASNSFTSTGATAAYNGLFNGTGGEVAGRYGTITLHGLKVGDEYQLQLWVANYAAVVNSPGTFTPTVSSPTLTLTLGAATGYNLLNAISLEDIPEPSTLAMMLGGATLIVLGVCLKRVRGSVPSR